MWLPLLWLVILSLVLCKQNDKKNDDFTDEDDAYAGDLIYLQILTSNGFYAPLEILREDVNPEDIWPDGLGKLTKLGKKQMFQLGKDLRKRYRTIITTNPKEVTAFSSAEDRTIESMLCLLASLYAPSKEWRFAPNFKWQPITVSATDPEHDKYTGFNAYCPKLIKEYRKILRSPEAQAMMEQDEIFYSICHNNTGLPMQSWNNIVRVYDVYSRERQIGLTIPLWLTDIWDDVERIVNIAYKWNFNSRFGIKAKVGSIIDLMIDRMRAKTLEEDPDPIKKVDIYATHDWNIAAFLASMFRFNGVRPPPATTITLELYRYFDTYRVRFLFFNSSTPEIPGSNDNPVPLRIRGCDDYCPLAYVVNYFKDFIPKNWHSLCGLRTKEKTPAPEEDIAPFSLSKR